MHQNGIDLSHSLFPIFYREFSLLPGRILLGRDCRQGISIPLDNHGPMRIFQKLRL
jgi:hypothetical protein